MNRRTFSKDDQRSHNARALYLWRILSFSPLVRDSLKPSEIVHKNRRHLEALLTRGYDMFFDATGASCIMHEHVSAEVRTLLGNIPCTIGHVHGTTGTLR